MSMLYNKFWIRVTFVLLVIVILILAGCVDGAGNSSAPSTAKVTVKDSQLPTAVLDTPSSVEYGKGVILEGRKSSAIPPHTIARYVWTLTASAGGGGLPLDTPVETTTPRYVLPFPPTDPLHVGTHTFQLVVIDDVGNSSAPSTAKVTVKDS